MEEQRLIDANALRMKAAQAHSLPPERMVVGLDQIGTAPTVDPVRHGHWVIDPDGYYPYCSECKREPEGHAMTEFCPHCGAKMDGDTFMGRSNGT